jgi:photosystem II stability/assembly factor-like uncharacterized protein
MGTTGDGWQYFLAHSNRSVVGIRQIVSDFSEMFATSAGSLLGVTTSRIYRSTDGGSNWQELAADSPVLLFTEPESGTIFGRMGMRFGTDGRVGRSKDDGQTFEPISELALGNGSALFARDAQKLYVFTGSRVARSSNGGAAWEFVTDPLPQISSDTDLLVDEHESVYFFNGSTLWRKHPADPRWTSHEFAAQVVDVAALPDSTLVVATSAGLVRSTNFGDTWQSVPGIAAVKQLTFSADGLLYVLADKQVRVSPDQGATWQSLGPQGGYNLTSFAVLPDKVVLASEAGIGGRFFRSPVVALEVAANVEHPAVRPASCYDGKLSAGETSQDCGGSCRACADWERLSNAPPVQFVASDGQAFQTSVAAGTLVSTDLGRTWSSPEPSPEPFAEHHGVLYGRDEDAQGNPTLMQSLDSAKTWQPLGAGPLPGVVYAVLPSDDRGALFVGVRSSLYGTTDGGANWNLLASFPDASVAQLHELPSGELLAQIWGGGGYTLHKCTDQGTTWTPVSQRSRKQFALRDGAVYAAIPDQGILRSTDVGANWSVVPGTESLGNADFAFNSAGTLLALDPALGVFACKNGACARRGEPLLTAGSLLFVFPNDQALLSPFLSVATTTW